MANYEEKLLEALANKYRNSKKDSKTNVIARRTKISPKTLYKKYDRNDGDVAEIEAVNQAVRQCFQKGFVTYETAGFSNEIRDVFLIDEKIDEIETYLEKNYHFETKAAKRRYVERMISEYEGRSSVAELECEKLRKALDSNKIPAKYRETEDLLKALVFVENNAEELYLREVSMLVYGDSKYLEENVLHPLCRTLRDYLGKPAGEGELEDEVLEEYHIVREKQRLCMKGKLTVRIGGKELDLGTLTDGIQLFAGELEKLEWIHVQSPIFMTVENYTSWLRMGRPDAVDFYLGGYAGRIQRDFLKKVYADNPGLSYLHFGDIDAGGLYIHEHLCRATGIPFGMYRMSMEELKDERFRFCRHSLSDQDKVRLEALKKNEAYRELAAYMLERNVKLEQEIISYYE